MMKIFSRTFIYKPEESRGDIVALEIEKLIKKAKQYRSDYEPNKLDDIKIIATQNDNYELIYTIVLAVQSKN